MPATMARMRSCLRDRLGRDEGEGEAYPARLVEGDGLGAGGGEYRRLVAGAAHGGDDGVDDAGRLECGCGDDRVGERATVVPVGLFERDPEGFVGAGHDGEPEGACAVGAPSSWWRLGSLGHLGGDVGVLDLQVLDDLGDGDELTGVSVDGRCVGDVDGQAA